MFFLKYFLYFYIWDIYNIYFLCENKAYKNVFEKTSSLNFAKNNNSNK